MSTPTAVDEGITTLPAHRAAECQALPTQEGRAGYLYGYHAGCVDRYQAGIDTGFTWTMARALPLLLEERLQAMSAVQRLVVFLACGLGEDYSAIGAIIGVTPEGVRYHMKQAAKAAGLAGVSELRTQYRSMVEEHREREDGS